MHQYKNISLQQQVLTAEGDINPRVVEPDGIVVSSVPIENPNLKYINTQQQQSTASNDDSTSTENKEAK